MPTTTPTDPEILLLGPVELRSGNARLAGRKQRLLLSLLALNPGRATSTDRLVDALWVDDHPVDARRSLQVHVSKLRSVLEAAGLDAAIEHGHGGYLLDVAADRIDVHRFQRLVEQGTALSEVDPAGAAGVLDDALSLVRAVPFGDLAAFPALATEVRRLEDLRLRAVDARCAALLATGRHAGLVPELYELTDRHPLRERFWAHLMLALYRADRQGDALEAYERAREHLADQLGVDPSRELRDLHTRVLRQDPALRTPTGAVAQADQRGGTTGDERSLAILPFEVIGHAGDVSTLAAGLHSDLITAMSSMRGLTVISRTSVLAYSGTDKPVPLIARELGATDVLEGSLQVAGSRFRLSVRVIDGIRDVPRWVGSYDDEVTAQNVFAIQHDLAREIARELAGRFAVQTRGGGSGQPATGNLDAYRLVAIARSQFDLKTEEGLHNAIASYEEASRLDPTYAAALTGLADALVSADAYGHGDRHDLLPRAEKAVHQALALDPSSAEARTSLGVLHVGHQDGPAALAAFELAATVSPSHADAYNWASWVHLLTGDAAAGLDQARRAVELDPRAPEPRAHLALALTARGRPEEGLEEARRAGQLSPYTTATLYEAIASLELDRPDDAITVLEPLVARDEGPDRVPWAGAAPDALLTIARASLGDADGARASADRIDPVAFPFATGMAHLALHDVDAAVRAFGEVSRLTAWPCLALHHYHRALWRRLEGTTCLEQLLRRARRSWNLDVPAA